MVALKLFATILKKMKNKSCLLLLQSLILNHSSDIKTKCPDAALKPVSAQNRSAELNPNAFYE